MDLPIGYMNRYLGLLLVILTLIKYFVVIK